MQSAPRVSIVVPTYNSVRYLESTVRSILAQTMPDFELVLFDDGSSDRTVALSHELREQDSRVRVVAGAHLGIAASRNRGFAATDPRTEFVTFFDHDDVWEPNALETLVNALQENPACGGAHGLARCIDGSGDLWPHDDHAERTRERVAVVDGRIVPLSVAEPTSFGAELVRNYITTPGTSVVRRSAQAAAGSFESATVPCDDWDMNLRVCRRGPFAFVDQVVLNWRRHLNSASQTSKRWRAAYMEVRRRSVEFGGNTREQRAAARCAIRAELGNLRREATISALHGRFSVAARQLVRSLLLDLVTLQTIGATALSINGARAFRE